MNVLTRPKVIGVGERDGGGGGGGRVVVGRGGGWRRLKGSRLSKLIMRKIIIAVSSICPTFATT